MGLQASKQIVMFAKHASTTDVTAVPGSFMHLRPERCTLGRPQMQKLPRIAMHPQNANAAPLRGPLDLSGTYEVAQILKGLSGNTGAAIDPETTSDTGGILDVAAGTDSIDPAGAATTVTNAGSDGATKQLVVAEMARAPVGTVVMFQAPAGTFHVRQVRARAGASGAGALTLDRPWTGAVADGTALIRAARYKFDPAVFEHTHGAFKLMRSTDDGDIYLGGMCKAQLDLSRGRFVELITTWRFSDVQRATGAVPSFTAPTVGNGIVRVNNALWIGDDPYYVTDLKVDCGGDVEDFPVDSAPHGVQGYSVHKGGERTKPSATCTIFRGSNSGEVPEAGSDLDVQGAQAWDINAGEVLGSHDVAFQAGAVAGAFCYGVLPGAAITDAVETTVNGRRALTIKIEGFEPTDSNLAPFELHIG